MTKKTLTLFIPGLLSLPRARYELLGEHGENLSALCRVLSKAHVEDAIGGNYETCLANLFGISFDGALPVAALHHAYFKQTRSDDYFMCADPVNLKVDVDSLVLARCRGFDLSDDECTRLIDQLNSTLSEEEWYLSALTNDHWVMQLSGPPQINTTSIREVTGNNIVGYLPQGARAREWRSLSNEIQMLLYASDVNVTREAQRKPSVNSVWFWGEGSLASIVSSRDVIFTKVWSDDITCRALADYCAITHADLPVPPVDKWLGDLSPGNHLVVLDHFAWKSNSHSPELWLSAIGDFSARWCAGLLTALQKKILAEVILVVGGSKQYIVHTGDLRRFWRRDGELRRFLQN